MRDERYAEYLIARCDWTAPVLSILNVEGCPKFTSMCRTLKIVCRSRLSGFE